MTDISGVAFLKRRVHHDTDYACFLILGLISLLVYVVSLLPSPYDNALEAIAFIYGIPILLGSILALLIGVAFAILQWRHWPLILLAVMTILEMLVHQLPFHGWSFVVTGTALPLWWFFALRRTAH
jgi:hypothetical protein